MHSTIMFVKNYLLISLRIILLISVPKELWENKTMAIESIAMVWVSHNSLGTEIGHILLICVLGTLQLVLIRWHIPHDR